MTGIEALETRVLLAFTPTSGFTLSGDGFASVDSVAADRAGNFFITGSFDGAVDFDPRRARSFQLDSGNGKGSGFVARYSAAGRLDWARQIAMPVGRWHLAADAKGNVYLAGAYVDSTDISLKPGQSRVMKTVADSWDVFVAKYKSDGTLLWAQRYATGDDEDVYGVAVDGLGNVHIGGTTEPTDEVSPSWQQTYLASFAGVDGKPIRTQVFGDGTATMAVAGIAADPSGNVYLAGTADGFTDVDPSRKHQRLIDPGRDYLLQLTSDGGLGWVIEFDAASSHVAHLAADGAGVAIVGDYSASPDFDPTTRGKLKLRDYGLNDAFVARYNARGRLTFAKAIAGTDQDTATNVALDPASGDALVSGGFRGLCYFNPGINGFHLDGGGSSLGFVARFDATGRFRDAFAQDTDEGVVLAASAGAVVLGGSLSSPVAYDFDPTAGTLMLGLNLVNPLNRYDGLVVRYLL